MATIVNASGGTREIFEENDFRVVRLGEGWYQMECDLCNYCSGRNMDYNELRRFGHVH